MSREKCPQHIRFLGQAMVGGLSGAVLDAYDDHRLAMSLAVVGFKGSGGCQGNLNFFRRKSQYAEIIRSEWVFPY